MSTTTLIPLKQATDVERFGAKAANLARLLNSEIKTAQGVVLSVEALEEHLDRLEMAGCMESFFSTLLKSESLTDDLRTEATRIQKAILESRLASHLMDNLKAEIESGVTYVVRSSAPGEDAEETSFAGQFESILDCSSHEKVAHGICRVWASLFSERALLYSLHRQLKPQGMAVIIQRQVDATVSGVMFTRDPRNPSNNKLLVEYCAGLGDRLVSGQISPGRLCIDRNNSHIVIEATPDEQIALNHVLTGARTSFQKIALKLENLFQGPQDIEWSVDSTGKLYVLQSRPITAISEPSVGVVWTNANIAENFPDPICPMLRSFVSRGYAAYFRGLGQAFGISQRRMESMEYALDNLVDCHGGRLYYNLSNIHTVLHLAPGGPWLARFFNQFTGACEFPAPKRIHQSRFEQIMEILGVVLRVIWRYLRIQRGLKGFERCIDNYAAASAPAKLADKSPKQLADLLRGFLEIRLERWTNAALADTAAMVCYGVLQRLLRGQVNVDANDLLKGLPGLASTIPVEQLWNLSQELRRDKELNALILNNPAEIIFTCLRDGEFPAFNAALNTYFDTWGFRSSGELMLSRQTPQEDPLPVLRLIKSYLTLNGEGPAEVSRRQAEARRDATKNIHRQLNLLHGLIFSLVLRATQGSIRLRERARMKQALLYTRLRHVALALSKTLVEKRLLSQQDDVLYLSMEEAISLGDETKDTFSNIRQQIADRKDELSTLHTLSPPDSFVLPEGKYWQPGHIEAQDTAEISIDGLTGTGACGGRANGHAAVVLDVTEIDRISKDQILVTRQTDPGWAAVFFMIKGLVVERGGMLSHGAIIAREYGIPAVVGVHNATRLIEDGELLSVDGDQGRVDYVRE